MVTQSASVRSKLSLSDGITANNRAITDVPTAHFLCDSLADRLDLLHVFPVHGVIELLGPLLTSPLCLFEALEFLGEGAIGLNAQLYLATAYASQFVPGAQSEKNRQIAAVAIEEFEKVLERDPGNISALTNIASIYFNLKEWVKAKEVRRQLNELDPENPEHFYTIGVIDWTATYAERMSVRADLKIQNAPERPIPRRQRLKLADTNTDLVEEGIEALQKALLINPNYLEAMAFLNLIYREKADLLDRDGREEYLDKADALVDRHKETKDRMDKEAKETAPAS